MRSPMPFWAQQDWVISAGIFRIPIRNFRAPIHACCCARHASALRAAGYAIGNIDATIIAQAPKMAPHIASMVANIAADLDVQAGQVNIKAKTNEKLGYLGREEGIAAEAIALLYKK